MALWPIDPVTNQIAQLSPSFAEPGVVLAFSKGESYLAGQFRQVKRSLAEQFHQIKCSLAEPQAEISFCFGKGDTPNKNFRLPTLVVHFGVGGCGRTDSAGGAGQE